LNRRLYQSSTGLGSSKCSGLEFTRGSQQRISSLNADTQESRNPESSNRHGPRTVRRPPLACERVRFDLVRSGLTRLLRKPPASAGPASRQVGKPGLPGGRCSFRANYRACPAMVTETIFPSGRARAPTSRFASLSREIAFTGGAPPGADNAYLISVPPHDSQSRSPAASAGRRSNGSAPELRLRCRLLEFTRARGIFGSRHHLIRGCLVAPSRSVNPG